MNFDRDQGVVLRSGGHQCPRTLGGGSLGRRQKGEALLFHRPQQRGLFHGSEDNGERDGEKEEGWEEHAI